jgi:hypothetical protein
MPYLLVNENDGRVLGELDSADQGLRLLERLTRRHPDLGAGISVVHFSDAQGSLAGASTSVTVRVLPELPGAPGVPDLRNEFRGRG